MLVGDAALLLLSEFMTVAAGLARNICRAYRPKASATASTLRAGAPGHGYRIGEIAAGR